MVAAYPGLRAFWDMYLGYKRENGDGDPFLTEVENQLADVDAGRLTPAQVKWATPL